MLTDWPFPDTDLPTRCHDCHEMPHEGWRSSYTIGNPHLSIATFPLLLLQFNLTSVPPGTAPITAVTWKGVKSPMTSDAELHAYVQKIMAELAGTLLSKLYAEFSAFFLESIHFLSVSAAKDEIVSEELVVERSAPHLPNLTFVDLPGLRTSPAALKAKTEDCLKKYFAQKNMYVLVVPAGGKDISSDVAAGLIYESGKAADTIVVLSKADIPSAHDVTWRNVIVPQLLGEDPEMSKKGFKLCVATKCRDQDGADDTYKLEQSDKEELAWAMELLARPKLSAEQKERIGKNLTVRMHAGVVNALTAHTRVCMPSPGRPAVTAHGPILFYA